MPDGPNAAVPGGDVPGMAGWEDPPRRQSPGTRAPPVLSVDGFEGPLDWLLELARTRRVDLSRLSMEALADAFVDALTAALADTDKRSPVLGPVLARWGTWLVMAADLAVLCSRFLIPADTSAAPEDEDWSHRLRARAAMAAATDWLEQRGQLGRDLFNRGRADPVLPAGAAQATARAAFRTADVTALLRACLVALRLPPGAEARFQLPDPPLWSQAEAASRIRDLLPTLDRDGAPLGLFLPPPRSDNGAAEPDRWRRAAVAGTFGAALELARQGTVRMEQEAALASIRIRPGG